MSSHSETTKPLDERLQLLANLLAYREELAIANSMLLARDERIRALVELLREARDQLDAVDNVRGILQEAGRYADVLDKRLDALLKEADDG